MYLPVRKILRRDQLDHDRVQVVGKQVPQDLVLSLDRFRRRRRFCRLGRRRRCLLSTFAGTFRVRKLVRDVKNVSHERDAIV